MCGPVVTLNESPFSYAMSIETKLIRLPNNRSICVEIKYSRNFFIARSRLIANRIALSLL